MKLLKVSHSLLSKVCSTFFRCSHVFLPPIEDNRRLKKPRLCILRDSLLQVTEVSDVYRHWPITNFFWFGISGNGKAENTKEILLCKLGLSVSFELMA